MTLTIEIGFVTTVATAAFIEVNAQLNINSTAAGLPFGRLHNEVKAKN